MPPDGIILDYVLWAAQETYANPIYHLAAILPVAAYEAASMGWGGPWGLPVRKDQGALQSFLIGSPASAKSTAMRMSRAFHLDVMRETQGALWSEGNNPWVMAEGSVPGLLEACHDMYDADLGVTPALMFHEEVSSLLDKGGEVIDMLMQLFDTVPVVQRNLREYRKMRKEGVKPPSDIIKPAIGGVFCGTMNSAERTLKPSHFEGGLVSRSLWFSGEPDVDRYWTAGPDAEGRRALVAGWTHHGRRLSGLRLRGDASLACLSSECKAVLQPMFEKFRVASKHGQEVLAAQLQRGMGMAQVVAGIYALSGGSTSITLVDMEAAVKLVELSQATAKMLSEATVEDLIYRLFQKALRLIKAAGAGGLTRTDLNRHHLRTNAGILDAIHQLLEESGEVFITKKAGSLGRRPTIYTANEHTGPDNVYRLPRREQADDEPADSGPQS